MHVYHEVFSPEYRRVEEEAFDIMNAPPLGTSDNKYWSGTQVNVSSPVLEESSESLSKDLGTAGGAHTDNRDCGGRYTSMTAGSEIRKEVDPGVFHILRLRVYGRLESGLTFIFSGQERHGGTAPKAPISVGLDADDIR